MKNNQNINDFQRKFDVVLVDKTKSNEKSIYVLGDSDSVSEALRKLGKILQNKLKPLYMSMILLL